MCEDKGESAENEKSIRHLSSGLSPCAGAHGNAHVVDGNSRVSTEWFSDPGKCAMIWDGRVLCADPSALRNLRNQFDFYSLIDRPHLCSIDRLKCLAVDLIIDEE